MHLIQFTWLFGCGRHASLPPLPSRSLVLVCFFLKMNFFRGACYPEHERKLPPQSLSTTIRMIWNGSSKAKNGTIFFRIVPKGWQTQLVVLRKSFF